MGQSSITLSGSDEEGDTLSFTVLSQPKNGTLSGTAPTLSYSPNSNYSGSDSFSYKANDGTADSNAATVTITVNGVNDKPEVANQSVDVDEDGSVSITLSGSDEEGDTLSFTVLSQPKNGTLSGTASALSYSPNANYSGSDSFSYKANDGTADSNAATVTITVNGVNDKPEVANQSVDVDEDGSVSITLSGSDEEGDTLSFTVLGQPKNGTLSGTASALSYSPNANYSGSDGFSYKANDGTADSNAATVTITVNGVNDKPEVANQSVDVDEDGSVSITLSGSDEEGDTLSFTVLSQPKNGILSGTAPSLSYSPNANYSGSDSFSYKANDGTADSNAATVTITVNGVNDKPEVANQSVDVDEDGSVSITLSGSDEEGDTLSFTVLSQPKNGTLSGTASALSYSPNANYSGSDSFSYKANDGTADSNAATVTITVNGVNDKPEVANQSVDVDEDGSVSITLSGSDEEGDTLSFTVLSQPKNGTLSGTAPALSYSPNANYSGSDSFSYKANDGTADSNTATVTINVMAGSDLGEGIYFEEDFDGLTLGAFESDSESGGDGTDWTAQGPSGWTMGKSEGHGPTAGGEAVKEFDGWTFMDPVSWDATAGQERAQFKKGQGVIAVADSDEYDDEADSKFDAWLSTPEIDITGAEAGTLALSYDSSWRQEPQAGKVTVSYDGGEEVTLLELGAGTATAYDETVELDLKNPAGAKTAVISWDHQGHNNWWWAIDNVKVYKKMGSNPDLEDNWTILVYGHADHNLGGNLIGDLIEMEKVGSGDGLNIVVQTDFNPKAWVRGNKYTNNWLINYHNNIPADMKNKVCRVLVDGDKDNWTFDSMPIETLPETENMDNPQTLSNFINWGIENYPAKKYGLVLWDHGGQYTGYGGDSQNGT